MEFRKLRSVVEAFSIPSETAWHALMSKASVRTFAKRQEIISQGSLWTDLIFINRGTVRYFDLKDGNDISLQFIFSGNFLLDYSSFYRNTPGKYHWETIDSSELVFIPKECVVQATKTYSFWMEFSKFMAERNVIHLFNLKNSLILDSPEERYLQLFAERPKVVENIPQYMIASYLGISREHLSRIRRKIADG